MLHEVNNFLDPGFELAFKEHFELNKHLLRLVKELLSAHREIPLRLHLESLFSEKHFRNANGHFAWAFGELTKKFVRCFGLNLLNWHCAQFVLDQFFLARCSARNSLSANVFLLLTFFVAILIELKEAIFDTPNFDEFLGGLHQIFSTLKPSSFALKFSADVFRGCSSRRPLTLFLKLSFRTFATQTRLLQTNPWTKWQFASNHARKTICLVLASDSGFFPKSILKAC